MKYPLHKIVLFLIVLFIILMIYKLNDDKNSAYNEMENEIAYRDSIIKTQREKIQELEETQEAVLSTLQLREEEIEFWINISDLYRQNKKKEAQKLVGTSWDY